LARSIIMVPGLWDGLGWLHAACCGMGWDGRMRCSLSRKVSSLVL
jgi:hypothetical protein